MPISDDERPALILGSRSARRQDLLRACGIRFEARAADVDEDRYGDADPARQVVATAAAKARAIAGTLPAGTLLLTADTIVALDGEVFTKPDDDEHARAMLRRLAGRTHRVFTGVRLERVGGTALEAAVDAEVTFRPFDAGLVEAYVASGEPADKAGAYGIQGLGARLVAGVRGDVTCVVGLPMRRLEELYGELTGESLRGGRSLRKIALEAFPELMRLPEDCLNGLD